MKWVFCCQCSPTPTFFLCLVCLVPSFCCPPLGSSFCCPPSPLSCFRFLCLLLAWWLLTLSDFSLHFQLLLSQSMAIPKHCSLQLPPALPNSLIQESLRVRLLVGVGTCFAKDLVEAPRPQRGGTIYQ